MKPWQWILLAGGAVVVLVIIMKTTSKPANGAVNGNLNAAATLGGVIAGLFKGGNKVSAPSATATSIPGDTGFGPTNEAQGSAYAAAMKDTGYAASESAGSGFLGSGGYSGASVSPGTLTAPSFDIGTSGADFSN